MTSQLQMVPTTKDDARAFIERHHSHHSAPIQAIMWAAVELDGEVVCVGCLERPKARHTAYDARTGEVTRIASDGSAKNAASKCIASISRAALALGYTRLVSFTVLGEAGTSYKAAGWWVTGITQSRKGWSSSGRPRALAMQKGAKVRWEFGPEALPKDLEAHRKYEEAIGKVAIPQRRECLPLFTGEAELVGQGRR